MKVIKLLVGACVLTSAMACSKGSGTGDSSAQNSKREDNIRNFKNIMGTSPDLIPAAEALVKKLDGKTYSFVEERTYVLDTKTGERSFEHTIPKDEFTVRDSCFHSNDDGTSMKVPCKDVLSFRLNSVDTAEISSQTVPKEEAITTYSLNDQKELEIMFSTADDKIVHIEKSGTVITSDSEPTVILRLKSELLPIGDQSAIQNKISVTDTVYRAEN
jgi:hypothetical protein